MTQPRYTDEVLAALRTQAARRDDDPPDRPPAGHVRYHIAVEQTLLQGVAAPSAVAAALRGLADQLEHSKENHV